MPFMTQKELLQRCMIKWDTVAKDLKEGKYDDGLDLWEDQCAFCRNAVGCYTCKCPKYICTESEDRDFHGGLVRNLYPNYRNAKKIYNALNFELKRLERGKK